MASQKQVTQAELAAHSEKQHLWLAINGQVYDFAEFAPKHPGGPESKSHLPNYYSARMLTSSSQSSINTQVAMHPQSTIRFTLPV